MTSHASTPAQQLANYARKLSRLDRPLTPRETETLARLKEAAK